MGRWFSKNYEVICGVYSITNKVNGKRYIGKSDNIYARWDEHKRELQNGLHYNKYLQRSWNKYGAENFTFEILEECNDNDMAYEQEVYWIKFYDSFKNGYNSNAGGKGGFEFKHSEESIEKMKFFQSNRMKNPEAREQLSEAHNHLKRKLVQIKINTGEIIKWFGINEATRENNIKPTLINNATKSPTRYSSGSLWFDEKDYDPNFNLQDFIYNNKELRMLCLNIYQFKYDGTFIKKWTHEELLENKKFRNQYIYKCCDGLSKHYMDSIWLYEKDKDNINNLIQEYKKEIEYKCTPILIFDSNGVIDECESIVVAAKKYSENAHTIKRCCYGERASINSLIYKFKDNQELYDAGRKIGNDKRNKQIENLKKKIMQYDKNMTLVKIWDSLTSIHNELGYEKGGIIDVCKGRKESCCGYIWRYLEEDNKNSSSIFIG